MIKYDITAQWDGRPVNHTRAASIELSWKPSDLFVTAMFSAHFFNDPPAPQGPAGKPFPKLWDYEVVEIFFLSSTSQKYLEVEVSPHGQHLLLALNGTRNMIKDKLPMIYSASIDNASSKWTGRAEIPLAYFPRGVDKMNAYAIYGSGDARIYEALYPVPTGKFATPDFHRLDYFQDFAFNSLINNDSTAVQGVGKFWDTL